MKKNKGFTLIELLVVIAIIGILATVVAVNFSGATGKAKATAFAESMNEAGKAVAICAAGGSTLKAFSAGDNICTDTALVDAKWPTSPFQGYTYTGPTLNTTTNTVTALPVITGTPTITCTLTSGTIGGCR